MAERRIQDPKATTPTKKNNRVRIDAIVNAIKKGEYDDKLNMIQDAIQDRLKFKREEILAMVQEVYGPNAQIMQTRGNQPIQPGIVSSPSRKVAPEHDGPITPDPLGDDPEDATGEMESRSPVIGPFIPGDDDVPA